MSPTTTEPTSVSQRTRPKAPPSAHRDATRRSREHVHDGGARGRRERAQARAAEHRRILDLLRRGAGVTQILAELDLPRDTGAERLARAHRLRRVLETMAAANGNGKTQLGPRKLVRTLAYLDARIALLQADVEWAEYRR
jgi:hypothetical protein